jgi:hypothetical protein
VQYDAFITVALIASYAVFSFGPYLVWPSRWNILGHIQFAFFLTAYVIPLLWTNPFGYVRPSIVYLYTEIMMLGAWVFLLALPVGFCCPRVSLTGLKILTMPERPYRQIFRRRVIAVTFLCTLGLSVSFLVMGYVPMLAAQPLQAKYFQGPYRDGYLRAALILRPSFFALGPYLSLAMVVAATERRFRYYFLASAAIVAIAGYLERGELGVAMICGVGIILAARCGRLAFSAYMAAVIIFVTIGTLGNYFLGVYLAIRSGSFEVQEQASEWISGGIAQGAPDISEGLRFFDNFEQNEHFTYGAQFIAGLVPLQRFASDWLPIARYNPGPWAQGVLLGTDDPEMIENVGGGGLRIAVPISGYAAFGWFGAVLMSAVAGFLTGYLVRFAKSHVRGSIEQSASVIVMYLAFSSLALSPTSVTWYEAFQPMILAWLIYPLRPISLVPPPFRLKASFRSIYAAE